MKIPIIEIIKYIENKKNEAKGYLEYFEKVEINFEMQMYAKIRIEIYEEIIKMLENK